MGERLHEAVGHYGCSAKQIAVADECYGQLFVSLSHRGLWIILSRRMW